MTVKEIIKTSATLLGREEVVKYIDGGQGDADTLSKVNVLTRLINLVINELAGSFIPMIKSEEISVLNDKIYYKDLSENLLNIVSVTDMHGNEISYEKKHEYIAVNLKNAIVEYEYLPANYGLEDSVGYEENQVSSRVLAYGLAAEFCITEGAFDEAVMWHKRYADGIERLCIPSSRSIKGRCFI